MAISVPPIQMGVPIVDLKTGGMTSYFSSWLTDVLNLIASQVNLNTSTIVALQQTQAQLQATIATLQAVQASAGGGGMPQAGFASATLNVGIGWSAGPQVNLTSVAAGNLTITGSGPIQQADTFADSGTYIGDWRIQEVIGLSETTVFTGTFTSATTFDPTTGANFYSLYNNTSTLNVSIPRTSTGAVSYRMDLEFTDPISAFNVGASLYVSRA